MSTRIDGPGETNNSSRLGPIIWNGISYLARKVTSVVSFFFRCLTAPIRIPYRWIFGKETSSNIPRSSESDNSIYKTSIPSSETSISDDGSLEGTNEQNSPSKTSDWRLEQAYRKNKRENRTSIITYLLVEDLIGLRESIRKVDRELQDGDPIDSIEEDLSECKQLSPKGESFLTPNPLGR